MKKIIIKQEDFKKDFKENLKEFNLFKKEWRDFEKVFISRIFYFNLFEKKKNKVNLGLDFRNILEKEIPNISDIKSALYIFINKDSLRKNLIKNKKKLIYSFDNLSFDNKTNLRKELKKLLDRKQFESERSFNLFLKNLYLEIHVEISDEGELFKAVTFIKKELAEILDLKQVEKINILLKNSFSDKENENILKSKILKIDGIISG